MRQHLKISASNNIYLNSQQARYANEAKYLDMYLAAKLRWKVHVKKKKQELNMLLQIIKPVCLYRPDLTILLFTPQIAINSLKNFVFLEICPREGLECDISQKAKFCQLPDEVPLDKDGDIIAFKMNNFMSLKKILTIGLNNNNKLYVNGLYDDDKKEFKLFTTDAYKNYTLTETQTDFSLQAYFKCDGNGIAFESIYTFNVKISQTNLFPPQFSQEEYEKQISLPLIKGFGCIFSKVVKATDHDIKYNKITFSSDNEYLEVGTEVETADNGHTYFAAISIKKAITEINETFVIEIEAKDNGNPPLSSKTKLKLIADKQKSLPMQPRFTNAIYETNLTKPEDLQINAELDLTTYDETIVFNVTDRDSELFTINRESNKINIRLKDNKVDDEYVKERSYLSFILNAHNPKLQIPGQTAIVVGIPKNAEDIKKIYFEKDLYRGEINLILKDDANWDGKYYLHISILAKMDEIIKSSTNVIIDVPVNKKDFRFEKPLFEGQINQTNQLEKLQIKFVDNENLNEIFFQILGENSNYFTIEIFENFAELKLKESELPAEWSKKKFLSFQIEARKHSYDAIYCGILVNLPNKLQLPQFPEILYKGKIISKKEIEELEIPVHNLGSRFGLSGHNSFTIDQRDGIIKIMLAGELSDEDLQLNYIALTLTAIFDEIDGGKSSTTIILSTPPLKLPPETSTSKPTTTSTTDGSTAATTTTSENPEPEKVPKFEKGTYRFSIKADFVGIFGSVKAILEEESSRIIEYSTANVDDELKTRLLLYDDGRLGVSSTTPPGTYVFEFAVMKEQK
ncbi:uncharacterized protein LOC129605988 [Condylostylus longicornis]|uniref:uncharacterized protein LOC129605988 n=1 Tax=Condylostylus longicornis TaxID=2530218 RepID=UPI00244DF33D|nr:uncharacterized protein LOC129605988 [Condylostylus longicornis]